MTKRNVSHSSMARRIASGNTSASAMVSVSSHDVLAAGGERFAEPAYEFGVAP